MHICRYKAFIFVLFPLVLVNLSAHVSNAQGIITSITKANDPRPIMSTKEVVCIRQRTRRPEPQVTASMDLLPGDELGSSSRVLIVAVRCGTATDLKLSAPFRVRFLTNQNGCRLYHYPMPGGALNVQSSVPTNIESGETRLASKRTQYEIKTTRIGRVGLIQQWIVYEGGVSLEGSVGTTSLEQGTKLVAKGKTAGTKEKITSQDIQQAARIYATVDASRAKGFNPATARPRLEKLYQELLADPTNKQKQFQLTNEQQSLGITTITVAAKSPPPSQVVANERRPPESIRNEETLAKSSEAREPACDYTKNRPETRTSNTKRPGSQANTGVREQPTSKCVYQLASVSPPTPGTPAQLGITIWRLRPARTNDRGPTVLVGGGAISQWVPERVRAGTPFREGEAVRFSIESDQPGYVYVLGRELLVDGRTGPATLIYPEPDMDTSNRASPGTLIDIPTHDEEPSYFILRPRAPNHAAKILTVIVTSSPLDLPKFAEPLEIPNNLLAQWEKLWSGQTEHLELQGGAGKAWTTEERQAAISEGGPELTREDPAPQTIFRVFRTDRRGLLVNILLGYAR